MRVCLINPLTLAYVDEASQTRFRASQPDSLEPPLGILTLAAVLEQHDIIPELVDLNVLYFEHACQKDFRGTIAQFREYALSVLQRVPCELFGFGTICGSYHLTLQLAQALKQRRPEVTIVLGGPQASVVSVETLDAFSFVDLVVRGEAEETLPRLLDELSSQSQLAHLPGITYRDGSRIVRNADAPLIADLDGVPAPAFHRYDPIGKMTAASIEIGRGCPFRCTFCSTNDFFRRRFRLRSAERVLQDMRALRDRYGMRRFYLVHDLFTVDRKKVAAFCNLLLESGDQFRWSCTARTDLVDEKLLALMAEAGCAGIFFGIESGSSSIQHQILKNLDLKEARKVVRCADGHGMNTTVSLITGFPEERREDLRQTIEFFIGAAVYPNVEAQMNLLTPLAGTPVLVKRQKALVFDGVGADWFHPGAPRDAESMRLVEAHPAIFPNFHCLETPWLDRGMLRELLHFLQSGMPQALWLFALLNRVSADFLQLFEQWRNWVAGGPQDTVLRKTEPWNYYSGETFRKTFLDFARGQLLDQFIESRWLLEELLRYEVTFDPWLWPEPVARAIDPLRRGSALFEGDAEGVPRRHPGVGILRLNVDFAGLVDALQTGEPLSSVRRRTVMLAGRVGRMGGHEVYEISEASAWLLHSSDGSRNLRQLAAAFASAHGVRHDAALDAACLHGVELLWRRGLLDLEQPSAGASGQAA